MHMLVDLVWPSCVWMLVAGEALVCVPVWCMDVCRNVDSFPFRQIFALAICPTFRIGHAEIFRRSCMHVCLCMVCVVLINSLLLYV